MKPVTVVLVLLVAYLLMWEVGTRFGWTQLTRESPAATGGVAKSGALGHDEESPTGEWGAHTMSDIEHSRQMAGSQRVIPNHRTSRTIQEELRIAAACCDPDEWDRYLQNAAADRIDALEAEVRDAKILDERRVYFLKEAIAYLTEADEKGRQVFARRIAAALKDTPA
jgi:hypothetical protein